MHYKMYRYISYFVYTCLPVLVTVTEMWLGTCFPSFWTVWEATDCQREQQTPTWSKLSPSVDRTWRWFLLRREESRGATLGQMLLISLATVLKCDVYHLLRMCTLCFEVRMKFWISICLIAFLSCVWNFVISNTLLYFSGYDWSKFRSPVTL